jgi:hypothetical protein
VIDDIRSKADLDYEKVGQAILPAAAFPGGFFSHARSSWFIDDDVGGLNSGSTRTVPVKYSTGPLPEGCEPIRLISIVLDLYCSCLNFSGRLAAADVPGSGRLPL